MKKTLIAGIVVAASLAVAIDFIAKHPELRHQLTLISPLTIFFLLLLYCGFIGSIGLILLATLRLCSINISGTESLLITMYSSMINFFGPLQSGPAFRAVYLKRKYNIKLKEYGAATIAYYIIYAALSGLFLLGGLLKWWLLLGIPIVVIMGLVLRMQSVKRITIIQRLGLLNLRALYYLIGATFVQAIFQIGIYFVELHAVHAHANLGQVIVYTGAANFALFVAITPGAIGFRESFLVFSRHLHHISNISIIAANVIDRSVYIVLLGILAIGIFSTHANRRLKASNK